MTGPTYTSWRTTAGVDMHTLQKPLRHRTIEMTMRYGHPSSEHLERIRNRGMVKLWSNGSSKKSQN